MGTIQCAKDGERLQLTTRGTCHCSVLGQSTLRQIGVDYLTADLLKPRIPVL